MKFRAFLLACAISASAFSFNVFSKESKLCTNSLKAVCEDTKTQRDLRETYINDIKKNIAKEAQKKANPRIADMVKNNPGTKFFFKRVLESQKITNQEIMKIARTKISGLETVVTDLTNVLMLKNYMRKAIDESNFDRATRVSFKKIIDSVQIGNFSDFLERGGVEDSLLSQMFNPCGSDGMNANAFATTLGDERYVLICPGYLITLSQTASKEERLNSILQAISHEMGHHIDTSPDQKKIYKPFLSCISRNYSSQLASSKEDQKICIKKAKNKSECRMKVTMSHAKELVADQWGIKVLAIHAREEGYSINQADKLLVNSWSNLCGSEDEGTHPSGDFRIGTLLRLNPEISDFLSCKNSTEKSVACTFDGEIKL